MLFLMAGLCSLSISCVQNVFVCNVSFQYIYSSTLESYADYDCINSTNTVPGITSI